MYLWAETEVKIRVANSNASEIAIFPAETNLSHNRPLRLSIFLDTDALLACSWNPSEARGAILRLL